MIGYKMISITALGLVLGTYISLLHLGQEVSHLKTKYAELDAKIGVTDGKHDSSLEYLLDKHAVHEAEIASLKKRLSKKPVSGWPTVHEHRHLHVENYIDQTVKPLTPYDQPASH